MTTNSTKPRVITNSVPANKEFKNIIVLPYFPKINTRISRILNRFCFKVVFSPTNKISFSNLKDPIDDHNTCGIYRILCECGLSYIEQTKRALRIRLKEHQNYVRKQEFEKSTIAKHCWNSNHQFNYPEAKIIQTFNLVFDLDFYEYHCIHKHTSSLVNDMTSTPFLLSV